MVAKNGRKRIAPSRQRYEANNPVISIRIPKELHQTLIEVRQTTSQSWTDLLMVALRLQAPVLAPRKASQKELEAEFEEGFTIGYETGEEETKAAYMVTYRCSGCNRPIEAASNGEKQAMARYMAEHRWGHGRCVKGRR